eukprot:2743446-Amphidinium_carterae.1
MNNVAVFMPIKRQEGCNNASAFDSIASAYSRRAQQASDVSENRRDISFDNPQEDETNSTPKKNLPTRFSDE